MSAKQGNVRYWHKADIGLRRLNVCFGRKCLASVPFEFVAAFRVSHLNLLYVDSLDGLCRSNPFSHFCDVP